MRSSSSSVNSLVASVGVLVIHFNVVVEQPSTRLSSSCRLLYMQVAELLYRVCWVLVDGESNGTPRICQSGLQWFGFATVGFESLVDWKIFPLREKGVGLELGWFCWLGIGVYNAP